MQVHRSSQTNLPDFRIVIAAALVCLLAWAVFVLHLNYEGMRLDEDFSWKLARNGPIELIPTQQIEDVHPPLHYLWLWSWMTWTASEDLLIMRLTAAIPALLAVAVCYRIGRDWFGSVWAGLGSALFLGGSGLFVYYATNLRMYSLIVLLAALNWWFLLRLLRDKRGGFIGYTLTLILMAYTYYFSAFIIGAQVLLVLLFYRKKLPRLLLAAVVTGLALLPWLPIFSDQMQMEQGNMGDRVAPVGKYLGTTSTSLKAIEEFIQYYTAGQPAYVLLLLVIAVFLGWKMQGQRRTSLIAALLWFFLTAALFFGVNLIIPVYGLRYTLTIIPGLALLAGIVVQQMPSRGARLGVLVVIALVGITSIPAGLQTPTPPNREMLRFLGQNYLPGDRIWYNLTSGARGSSVLETIPRFHLRTEATNLSTDWFVWDAPTEFIDPAVSPRVWDVRPYWIALPEWAASELNDGRVNAELHNFAGYSIRLYEAPPPEQQPAALSDLLEVQIGPLDRAVYHPGETVIGKTWWRAVQPLDRDYSYTFLVQNEAGSVIYQQDDTLRVDGEPTDKGFVMEYGRPTTGWTPAAGFHLATPVYEIPADLPAGEYTLWIGTYYWEDPVRFPIESAGDLTVDEAASLVQVAAFTVAP